MGVRACLCMNDHVRVYLLYASVCVHMDVCVAVLLRRQQYKHTCGEWGNFLVHTAG